ncbi:MAG: glycosyltransferase [Gammaproteobacteria bacterium]|nr:glycosyltransferase [Gammaproteobacteria bacterium]
MINSFSASEMSEFRRALRIEFDEYLEHEANKYDRKNCLKIDLHCHDFNSDKPDELWGRILSLPETWLKTKKLVKCLTQNGCDVVTVTNHNNARSCWELLDSGHDVLVAAEFTCFFPEYNLFVHVLTYGFTRQQEKILNNKRENIYDFLRYAASCNIPVILPHPLYFYTRNDKIDLTLFEKLAVMFQRFEVLNGQRDLWQSVLTLNWAKSLTPEKIIKYARKHGLDPAEFDVDPYKPKILSGGSDCHMGIFAGQCGSYLYVPDLKEKLRYSRPSELALEAIRNGNLSSYGHVAENQKLNIALLDYFSQVATKIKDPGLLRILFHRGEVSDKVACFALSNLLLEMQKHKNTQKFFEFVHDALQGKKPGKLLKWKINKDYRFCVKQLEKIADCRSGPPEVFINTVNQTVTELFTELSRLVVQRVKKLTNSENKKKLETFSTEEITRKFEIPSQLTVLLFGNKTTRADMSGFDFSKLLDNLSFPVLISLILTGATLGSTRLLYQNRNFLNDFADHIGKNHHPKRALYLTDTLRDKNGVSSSLSGKLAEIQAMDMPVDFLICHADAKAEPHLHVVRPLASFSVPDFGEQEFRIPDLLEIARVFYEGGYDRIVCSTEGPMALVSLFIKHMFNVPSFFFMHTDWLDFIKNTTDLNVHERDRLRRTLRVFYKQYAGVFVLNNEHRNWLTGHQMQLDEDRVYLTAHHTGKRDKSIKAVSKSRLFPDAHANTPVLLFAGRLSKEKGVFDLPDILANVKQEIPDIRLVIAGTGPAEEALKQEIPEALFLGWIDKKRMAELYSGLDLFVFPSRFDTFGNVIIESFVYGMPAIAYDCKGPKDIIQHDVCGYLVNDIQQMSEHIISHFSCETKRIAMKQKAMLRAGNYQAGPIMQQFIHDMGLADVQGQVEQRSVA